MKVKQKSNKLVQFKQRISPVVMPRYSIKKSDDKRIKSLFLAYFDDCCDYDTKPNTYNTFAMGICKLEYKNNKLTVYLRRPGLLIGKGGQVIDALAEFLKCKIDIIEVDLCKD
jgi:hypothetical protein